MMSSKSRQIIYPLLLLLLLAAALWLAALLGRNAVPQGQGLVFAPPPGDYPHSLLLEIQAAHPGASIIFSTDGSIPDLNSGTLYERPLRLDADAPGLTVVRAREIIDGAPGPVFSASYNVGAVHALPILSIITEPAHLWDAERGILTNSWQRGQDWERPVHVTYIPADDSAGFEIGAGLRIHDDLAPLGKQSFRLYFRQDYGAARLEYPLFPNYQQDVQSYKRLLLQAGGEPGRWSLLGDQLLAEVAAEMNRHVARGRFVLLFLNGVPWGIYRLSERIDSFFLQDNLDIASADLIREGKIAQGDSQHWDALLAWLGTHAPGSYAYLQTQIDVDDLSDYIILQTYFGLSRKDFDAARTRDAGGRWVWLYGGRQTQGEYDQALQVNDASDLGLLWSKLLEDPAYRGRFVGRVADLLNTSLSSSALEARLDRLAAQLQADLEYETARWPTASGQAALDNAEHLRQFVWERPGELRQQVMSEFGLRGTARLTFTLPAAGGGYLLVNNAPITASSWSGVYFLESQVYVTAVPQPGYAFAGWEGPIPLNGRSVTLTVDGPGLITPHFAAIGDDDPALRPNDVIINEYWINDNGTRYAGLGGQSIEGDWFELLVTRPRSIDLRGWRITDNDAKTDTNEGSIIIPPLGVFAAVPRGTVILIIATENAANAAQFRLDDLDPSDGQMLLYAGNGHLDLDSDPGFNIGTGDDNLVVLAPGYQTNEFADDVGVDFVAEGSAVTPLSFGVLIDGVRFDAPFQGLGNDDGALFVQKRNNDNGAVGWRVDPAAYQTGDDARPGATNILTPGALNYGQSSLSLPVGAFGLLLAGLAGAVIVWRLRVIGRR